MTEKQTELFETLVKDFNTFSVKLFGNGTRVGCMDERLERVEGHIAKWDKALPDFMSKTECRLKQEKNWLRHVKETGLIIALVTLILKVFNVI